MLDEKELKYFDYSKSEMKNFGDDSTLNQILKIRLYWILVVVMALSQLT